MGEQILLVNPSKPRGKRRTTTLRTAARIPARTKTRKKTAGVRAMVARRKTSRKRRSPAQMAAFRKMIAGRRRKNPIARRKSNPHRRRRSRVGSFVAAAVHRVRRRRRNPIQHRVHRRRRNPISLGRMGGIVHTMIKPAFTAAAGAIALDVAWAYLPVPASIKTGQFKYIAKGAGAIGLAMIARKVVKRDTADKMGVGALTVVMHSAMSDLLAKLVPSVRMSEYVSGYMGAYNPAYPAGSITDDTMGQYVSGLGGGDSESYVYDSENDYAQYYR